VMVICVAAMSVSFLVYIIVGQYLLGFQLGWFPVQGWSDDFWRNLFTYAPLPILLAALVGLAPQTRLYRSFFLDETKSDYVRTARAKGLSEPAIMRKHVLRNALVPVLTNVSLLVPGVFVGSFLLEIFFSIPGLGREIYLAVNRSAYPVIQAVTIYLSVRAMTLPWGGDRWGRDVLDKAIKGSQVSIAVGVLAALCATVIGTLLGACAGFYGRWVNDVLEWLYNVFTSIPSILLIFSLAAVLRSGAFAHLFASGIWTVVIILSVTGWTGMYRLVRAEYMKHRSREYVLAAQAIGASAAARMFAHILPNVSHALLVQLSLLAVAFIKVEVILSFLRLGVPLDMVSS